MTKLKPLPPLPRPTTYSIRLGEAERALLARVLEAKGWTATHFIRQATLEKAAHVDNKGRFTKFDFDGLARRLAKRLCEPEILLGDSEHPEFPPSPFKGWREEGDLLPTTYATTEPPPLNGSDVDELRKAVRLGGSEFLQLVLDECDRLMVRHRSDLPDAVDPSQFS